MNKQHREWIILMIGLFAWACALPGLSTPSEFPTPDANSISTIIAGTANASAATQTAQANPSTSIPLPTLTETTAPTSTTTPQLIFSSYNTALRQQADGSTFFVDQKLGYELVTPSGWTAFRINEPEFYKMWELPESANSSVLGNLTSIQAMDPNIFRLFAYDLRNGHVQIDALTTIDVSWTQDSNNYSKFISGLQRSYSRFYLSNKVLSSQIETTSSGLEVNIVEFEIKMKDLMKGGTNIEVIYEKQIIFKVPTGMIAVRLDTTYDLKDTLMPEFDQIKESIKVNMP